MANFYTSYNKTARYEGGYANHPADKGGETYAGIARNYWPNWEGWQTIDAIKRTAKTAKDINAKARVNSKLQDSISDFYRVYFWKNLGGLNSQQLADSVYDMSVNAGVGRASKMLQQAYNQVDGIKIKLVEDGAIGPKTISAINELTSDKVGEMALHMKYSLSRADYYKSIAKGNQAQFLAGWLKRIERYV